MPSKKLSYSDELSQTEVNKAVAHCSCILSIHLHHFSLVRLIVRAIERAHVKYSWSVTICNTIKQITTLPFFFTAVVPSTGTPEQSICSADNKAFIEY